MEFLQTIEPVIGAVGENKSAAYLILALIFAAVAVRGVMVRRGVVALLMVLPSLGMAAWLTLASMNGEHREDRAEITAMEARNTVEQGVSKHRLYTDINGVADSLDGYRLQVCHRLPAMANEKCTVVQDPLAPGRNRIAIRPDYVRKAVSIRLRLLEQVDGRLVSSAMLVRE